ncbi:hypothetical protein IIA29_06260 [candidate division KSB1 bacterium]|nr:hypothetical protein [candidate division KSB1 bacterium]TDI87050.1 MAG: hypothetical protein E2O78_01850 [Caldithrix sp.]
MIFSLFALALVSFLVVAILAWWIRKLSARLESTTQSLTRTRRKLEFVEETLGQEIAKLRYGLKKNTGQLTFHGDMTFKEALAINPRVQEIMGEMHVGGCPDCAVDLKQTLAYGAAINNVGVEDFLVALNDLPESKSATNKPDKSQHPELVILQ